METLVPFPDVSSGGEIGTESFIKAAKSVVEFLEKFGPLYKTLTPDIWDNIEMLERKYKQNQKEFKYLNSMILKEKQQGGYEARVALLWLRRGLELFFVFLEKVVKQSAVLKVKLDLRPLILEAYEETLEQFHGHRMRRMMREFSQASPTYEDFLQVLKANSKQSEKDVLRLLPSYMKSIHRNTKAIYKLYADNNIPLNDVSS